MDRPTVRKGDYGQNVREVQTALKAVVDGEFGSMTEIAVKDFQLREALTDVDGVVGPVTWEELGQDFKLPFYPPALPTPLSSAMIETITAMALDHPIADYSWRDRGTAPAGYVAGMALAYAQVCQRWAANDPIAIEMAKGDTHDETYDVLTWYAPEMAAMGWGNEVAGIDTLRHLYVLIMGLGMRESSGKHCCGRDMSADNVTADTCESGLFQTSWNASTCCTDIINLSDQYALAGGEEVEVPQGYIDVWAQEVECSSADWQSYGSGDGFQFQEMCKYVPTFAVESAALVLRNLRKHYGPVNRREIELRREANEMFMAVERLIAPGV